MGIGIVLIGERKVSRSPCPHCGTQIDRAMPVLPGLLDAIFLSDEPDESGPDEGSLSVCIYCAQLVGFDEQMHLRRLSEREMYFARMSPQWPLYRHVMEVTKQVLRRARHAYN